MGVRQRRTTVMDHSRRDLLAFSAFCLIVVLVPASPGLSRARLQRPIRLGIIGVDTLHAEVFTKILNDPNDPEHVPGAQVVVAYKGGSPDIEYSREVVDKYAEEFGDKWHV